MSKRASFECVHCQQRISPSAYRATCPECGGSLRQQRVV
ncbi:rubrerythrin-like domain-containing protein [Haloplanus sp. C73]